MQLRGLLSFLTGRECFSIDSLFDLSLLLSRIIRQDVSSISDCPSIRGFDDETEVIPHLRLCSYKNSPGKK